MINKKDTERRGTAMFGYVKTCPSELRLRDYECYRAYYCGLCKTMGSCTGQCSRLTLSYDFVFLAAVRCSLAGEEPDVKRFRCLLHPLRRRKRVKKSPQLSYCADASALLTAAKIADDLADERGFRRLRAFFRRLFFGGAARRARRRHPDLYRTIADDLSRLRAIEEDETIVSADAPAEVFGHLLGAIFSAELSGDAARIAAAIGDAVGRWIYLADAADDLAADAKKGRYNPLLRLFGQEPTAADWETVRTGLTATLFRAQRAFELIDAFPCPELREILANILYLGLPKTTEKLTHAPQKSPKENTHEQ